MQITRYHVMTFNEAALQANAGRLLHMVRGAGFVPELVIGIRTGGYVVAEKMKPLLDPSVAILPFTCRRPGTKRKSKPGVKLLLRYLPYMLADRLRVVEHLLRMARKSSPSSLALAPDGAESDAIAAQIKALGTTPKILIVDDAVDSGRTLAAVEDAIRALAPSATVKSAAITVTMPTPIRNPEFSLYRYALCRFPWSFDFKPDRAGSAL